MAMQRVREMSFADLLLLDHQSLSPEEMRAIQKRVEDEETALDQHEQPREHPDLEKVRQEREKLAQEMEKALRLEQILLKRQSDFASLDAQQSELRERSNALELKLAEARAKQAGLNGQQRDMETQRVSKLCSVINLVRSLSDYPNQAIAAREDDRHAFLSVAGGPNNDILCEMMLPKEYIY